MAVDQQILYSTYFTGYFKHIPISNNVVADTDEIATVHVNETHLKQYNNE